MPTTTHTEEDLTPAASARMKRSRGEDVVPAPKHLRADIPSDLRQINGWGADLDPANRPSYPKELPSNVQTARGDVKDWQVPHTKVHISNEHPNLTPTFGASVPAKGLSGWLRDYAYEYGEATNRHWMTLLLADRVDMVESMVSALMQGQPDNYVAEKGWPALLAYDPDRKRKLLLFGAATVGLIVAGVVLQNVLAED